MSGLRFFGSLLDPSDDDDLLFSNGFLHVFTACDRNFLRSSRNGDARTVLSDAETALQQLLRGANAAEAKKALQTLSMMLQNLTSHPTQEKYKVREDGRGINGV